MIPLDFSTRVGDKGCTGCDSALAGLGGTSLVRLVVSGFSMFLLRGMSPGMGGVGGHFFGLGGAWRGLSGT